MKQQGEHDAAELLSHVVVTGRGEQGGEKKEGRRNL